ncbi:hypothetical protein PLESTB_000227600 [Pleodorina starrii]|uniref:Uncharacterized protein n=1 Tax=Pleodorina starrii TaxID=330485 RepID=A0A9W6EYR8_9CHLO|nr:hypothetical protein PLESTB_000227600 [Pleodorina starrii]
MPAPLNVLGEPRVGVELLAAADVRSVRALTGNPEDTRVIARFSWHRSIADVRAGANAAPHADDATAWTLIPGAMRPAYQCTEDDAGRWLRVTVVPLAASSSGGRGSASLDSRLSGGQGANRPMLKAVAGPILGPRAGEQAPLMEPQQQSSNRMVMVEGQYTAVAEGGHRLMVHLNPSKLLAEGGGRQQPPQQQQQMQQPIPAEPQPPVGLSDRHHAFAQPAATQPDRPAAATPNAGPPPPASSLRPYASLPPERQPDPPPLYPRQSSLLADQHLQEQQQYQHQQPQPQHYQQPHASRPAAASSPPQAPLQQPTQAYPAAPAVQQYQHQQPQPQHYQHQQAARPAASSPPRVAPQAPLQQPTQPYPAAFAVQQQQRPVMMPTASSPGRSCYSDYNRTGSQLPPDQPPTSSGTRDAAGGRGSSNPLPVPAVAQAARRAASPPSEPASPNTRWLAAGPAHVSSEPAFASPSGRPASGRVHELISGNFALQELQQWSAAVAAKQQPHLQLRHSPQSAAAAVTAPVPVSAAATTAAPPLPPPRDDAFEQLIRLAEASGDSGSRGLWPGHSVRSGADSFAAAAAAPAGMPGASASFPSVPQRPPARNGSDVAGAASERPQLRDHLSEPHASQVDLRPDVQFGRARSPGRDSYPARYSAAAATFPVVQEWPLAHSRSEPVGATQAKTRWRDFVPEDELAQVEYGNQYDTRQGPVRPPEREMRSAQSAEPARPAGSSTSIPQSRSDTAGAQWSGFSSEPQRDELELRPGGQSSRSRSPERASNNARYADTVVPAVEAEAEASFQDRSLAHSISEVVTAATGRGGRAAAAPVRSRGDVSVAVSEQPQSSACMTQPSHSAHLDPQQSVQPGHARLSERGSYSARYSDTVTAAAEAQSLSSFQERPPAHGQSVAVGSTADRPQLQNDPGRATSPRGEQPSRGRSPERASYKAARDREAATAVAEERPPVPQRPLVHSRSDVVAATEEQARWRAFLSQPNADTGIDLARSALSGRESLAAHHVATAPMNSFPPSPFGETDVYAYAAAAAAAAARETHAASPLPPQRLERTFQSVQSSSSFHKCQDESSGSGGSGGGGSGSGGGGSGGGGSGISSSGGGGSSGGISVGMEDEVVLGPSENLRNRASSGRQPQPPQQWDPAHPSGSGSGTGAAAAGLLASGGYGSGLGGGGTGSSGSNSLREALEQLLAQHQEIVSQASLDMAGSFIPALQDRHSAPAGTTPGLQTGGGGAVLGPHLSEAAAALPPYPLDRYPPPLPVRPQPHVRFEPQPMPPTGPDLQQPQPSVPISSRGSGSSSLSLSNSFGIGLAPASGSSGLQDAAASLGPGGARGSSGVEEGLGPGRPQPQHSHPHGRPPVPPPAGGSGGHPPPAPSAQTGGGGGGGGRRKASSRASQGNELRTAYLAQLMQQMASMEISSEVEVSGDGSASGSGAGSGPSSGGGSSIESDAVRLLSQLLAEREEASRRGAGEGDGRSSRGLDSNTAAAAGAAASGRSAAEADKRAPQPAPEGGNTDGGRGGGGGQAVVGREAPAPAAGSPARSSSSTLQDMRNMNEALLRQLTESTRLQVQMQRALDAAMEQIKSLHSKEQQKQQQDVQLSPRQSSPPPARQLSSPRMPLSPSGRQPSPIAPQSSLPRRALPTGDASPPLRRRVSLPPRVQPVSPSQKRIAASASVPANAAAAAAAARLDAALPSVNSRTSPLRRVSSHRAATGRAVHDPDGGTPPPARRARSPSSGAARQHDPDPPRRGSLDEPKASGRAEGAVQRREADRADAGGARSRGGASSDEADRGMDTGGRDQRVAGGGARAGEAEGGAALSAAGREAAGHEAAGREAAAAAALRTMLHQHHQRWRVKKAKLKEQAQAWQYTAWRYATAWKKARVMLQAMVTAQEGAAGAGAGAEPRRHHHHHEDTPYLQQRRPSSPPPEEPIPRDFRPLASEQAFEPRVRSTSAGRRAAEPPSTARAMEPQPGRQAEPPELRQQLSEPEVLAGIAAALQRRDPSPAGAGGERLSVYQVRGRAGGATAGPSSPGRGGTARGVVGSRSARDSARMASSPRLRSRVSQRPSKRVSAVTAAGGSGSGSGRGSSTRVLELEEDEDYGYDEMIPLAPSGLRSAPSRGGNASNITSEARSKHVGMQPASDGVGAVPPSAGPAAWSELGLDLGRLRDQGSRGHGGSSTGRQQDAGDGAAAPPPHRAEVATQRPTSLRDGARSRSTSPTRHRPPREVASTVPPDVRINRAAPELGPYRDARQEQEPTWPLYPAELPHPSARPKVPAVPYRDPEGWWHYPEGWIDIFQSQHPPHMLVQLANARAQRHHHRYGNARGDPAPDTGAKAPHPT